MNKQKLFAEMTIMQGSIYTYIIIQVLEAITCCMTGFLASDLRKGNGDFSWKQFLRFQLPWCCLNAHSCVQISECRHTQDQWQVHSSGARLACQIFIEVFTQSHLKKPNQGHWGVTQRADTVESYRKEPRESLFLATAKKRKLIA